MPQIVRFFVSGLIATACSIALLYILTDLLHLWYLASSVISFSTAVAVSFALQKYWTYRDYERTRVSRQASFFLLIQIWDLLLNSALLYCAVDIMHLWYLAAQVVISILIAVQNYLLYRIFVFHESPSA